MTATAADIPVRPSIDSAVLFDAWRRSGDRQARAELIERFLPLARALAGRYRRTSEPFEDLVQVACVGLINAVERFDPERGVAFTSFAIPTILGELKRHFRDSCWAVHAPRGAQERAHKISDGERALAARLGRSPTIGELASYLNLTDEEVVDGLEAAAAYEADSLDAPRIDEDGRGETQLEAIGEVDGRFEQAEAAATIYSAAKLLPARDRQVLFLRFSEDLTQSEIAGRIGISQMQVSRILRRTLQELRDLTAS